MFNSRVVSIDIGSRNIHIAEGKNQGSSLDIDKTIMVPTPANSFQDGRIESVPFLIEILRANFKQYRITSKAMIMTIQSNSIITRDIVLPAVTEAELKNAVHFEMEQYLPAAAGEYVIEFRVIDQFADQNGSRLRIRVAAMPRMMVEGYYHLIKGLNGKPLALDIHANCLSKLLRPEIAVNEEAFGQVQNVAVIDMGFAVTDINIFSMGRLEFSRSIPLGGRDIDTAFSNFCKVPLDKAEEKKKYELRLDQTVGNSGASAGVSDPIHSLIDQWINEMQKVFQYHASRGPGNRIEKVYLYGGGSNLKGLSKYMAQVLGIPTEKIESISSVKLIDSGAGAGIEYFINTAGSMIRYQ